MKGIVKQGVRCKDCGISCHKHCKDIVVVDCSKRKEKKSELTFHIPSTLPICINPFAEAKVREQRAATANHELYCDDDISLKERLTRAEAVSRANGMAMTCT